MNALEFDKVVHHLHEQCRTMLSNRAATYASDEDRFRNFKNVARMKGTDKYDALTGMMWKHIEAWLQFTKEDPTKTPFEQWTEKTIDLINYLTLTYGMVVEDFKDDEE
jgi:hypothetical protein